MQEVRREDGELCGHVRPLGERWAAATVFGATFAELPTEEEARRDVAGRGLAVLADRWELTEGADTSIVHILEADPSGVTVTADLWAPPGTPALVIPCADLTSGRRTLEHRP